MSDYSDLGTRLSGALDRISGAVASISVSEDASLRDALEAEREANAQLEARVEAIKERQEKRVAALEAQVASLKSELLDRDGDIGRLRGVNETLRGSNTALREANAAGLADASLVSDAMKAELDALRETVAAQRAEIDAVLARLAPMLEEDADA